MNPARSCERMTRFSSRPATNSSTRFAASSLVTIDGMSSTRCCTGHGVEEVEPEHVLGTTGRHRELHDRDRRRVRREDRVVVLEDLVDVREELELLVDRLDDGLEMS